MKKFKKVLSMAALSALFAGALTSCGEETTTTTPTTDPVTTTVDNSEDLAKAQAAANLVLFTGNHSKVDANFTVPTFVMYDGVKYNLTWHSKDEALLEFDVQEGEAGLETVITAVVHRPAADAEKDYTKVEFYATVTVGEVSANSEDFDVRVKRQQSAQEAYNSWVVGDSDTYSFTGYVLKKVGYVESYKEANLIVWDEAGCGAYFVYNAYLDKEVYDALQGGEYITVTGAVRSPYNGLLETKYGATATVDATHTKLDLSTLDYTDISDDAVLNQSNLVKYQSSKVALKNFKVVSVETFSNKSGKYGTTLQTVATLERAGVQIRVALYEGMTPFADPATKTLDTNLLKVLKVGDYVNVNGYLSWDSTPVIVVDEAAQVVKSQAGTADYDKAYTDLLAVYDTFKSFYAQTKEITLPATGTNGAQLTYTVAGSNVALADGKLTITASDTNQQGTLIIKSKVGSVQFEKTVTITSQSLTDAQVAEKVANAYSIADISAPGTTKLGTGEDTYGTTYAWTLKDAAGVAELSGDSLTVRPTTEDKNVVLTLTVTMGETTFVKDITVKVNKYTITTYGTTVADGKTTIDPSNFEDNKYYYVEGYITDAVNAQYGNTWIASTADGGKILQIYGMLDVYGNKGTTAMGINLPVGTKVVLYGQYVASYKELKNAVLVSYEIDYEAAAAADIAAAKAAFAASYAQAAEVTLPANVTAEVTAGTSAAVANGKVTITPTDTQETVTIVLTATEGTVTKTETITFTTKTVVVSGVEATAKYSSDTELKAETKAGTNYAAEFGLDPSVFTVTVEHNGDVALYNASTRIYQGKSLIISVAEGYAIEQVVIEFDTLKTGNITVGSTVISVTNSTTTEKVILGEVSSVTFTAAVQIRVKSISITYTQKAAN